MIEPQPVIDAQNIVFSYGSREVLKGLTLSVNRGEIFGMLGANGAGKTTLIRMLVGMLKPKAGSIRVLGEAPSSRQARQVGYMPQLSALYEELSIRENVDFFGRMYSMSDKSERTAAVEDAIRLVDLWERRDDPILDLSGGMRQRVSLAISAGASSRAAAAGRAYGWPRPGPAGHLLGTVQGDGRRRDHDGAVQPHDGRRGAL